MAETGYGDGYMDYYMYFGGTNVTMPSEMHHDMLYMFEVVGVWLLCLFSLAAIISNAVVLGAFCRMRCVLTSHLMLVVSLCTADMMVGVGKVIERISFPLGTGNCEATVSANLLLGMFVCSILT